MLLMDVNVFVYAFRADTQNHQSYREWLEGVINSGVTYGVSELVLSGFLRVVTHPRVFENPAPLQQAIDFVDQVRGAQNALVLTLGKNHWNIFAGLVKQISATGNDIPDAYHAALAMEWNCDWITTDKGFKRFKGLKTRHPLD
jgi:toxin-antitoxin system PIN domain toxin